MAAGEPELWAVVRQDTNGLSYLMAVDLTEAEANRYRATVLSQQTKQHRQDYYLHVYLV